ncbi:ParA family protein [Nocardia sp. 2]|uniref:ParA family protein n=1 Tax=Nocardia acididurans TaxID=2802282 RepID=A0ABS1MGE3_9NOCA|nr:ParA family protein [Nocardia acididurans]
MSGGRHSWRDTPLVGGCCDGDGSGTVPGVTSTRLLPGLRAVRRTILVANQKGGVGKSSIVAAIAVAVARRGKRVLVVDADQQGNCTIRDLGVKNSDEGRSLAMTLQYGSALEPVYDVREGLDVVCGGKLLAMAGTVVANAEQHGIDPRQNLLNALEALIDSGSYDLVLIDSGPGDRGVLDLLLQVVSWLIVPTKEDDGSIDGAELLARRYLWARKNGALVELMGMILFDCNPRAIRRNEDTLGKIMDLLEGTGIEPFKNFIRQDKATALDARAFHLTPEELIAYTPPRPGEGGESDETPAKKWSRDPEPLATDYSKLTKEVLVRLAAGERAKEAV